MRLGSALILVALALNGCGDFPGQRKTPKGPAPQTAPAAPPTDAATTPKAQVTGLPDFTVLVEKVGPAVVNVVTTRKGRASAAPGASDDPLFDFFRRFMPTPPDIEPETPGEGLGSGFITSADGYILTNAHVVAESNEVTVRFADAREFKAKVIGSDRRTDIALLKISAKDLPVVTLGSSEALKVANGLRRSARHSGSSTRSPPDRQRERPLVARRDLRAIHSDGCRGKSGQLGRAAAQSPR